MHSLSLSVCKQAEPLLLQESYSIPARPKPWFLRHEYKTAARERRGCSAMSVLAQAAVELSRPPVQSKEAGEEEEGQFKEAQTKDEDEGKEAASRLVRISTLRDCRLGIAMYPDFYYNAEGGGGEGTAQSIPHGRLAVEFDPNRLFIPPVQSNSTRFLGLPIPPFVCIEIVPSTLKGFIDQNKGKVELEFSANFMFSIGSWYRAPALVVDTLLTTELVQGRLRGGQGKRLNSQTGECKLVGIAPLVRVDDFFLDAFLNLPTECLASMAVKFTFSE